VVDQDLDEALGIEELVVLTRVVRVNLYSSFAEMLDNELVAAISGTNESRDELMASIREIYDEEHEQLGVLSIEIEVAD
jgi:ASC-1-like (ASCH) protein